MVAQSLIGTKVSWVSSGANWCRLESGRLLPFEWDQSPINWSPDHSPPAIARFRVNIGPLQVISELDGARESYLLKMALSQLEALSRLLKSRFAGGGKSEICLKM